MWWFCVTGVTTDLEEADGLTFGRKFQRAEWWGLP